MTNDLETQLEQARAIRLKAGIKYPSGLERQLARAIEARKRLEADLAEHPPNKRPRFR